MIGDARQHLAKIGFRIETIEFRGTDQAVDRRRAFPRLESPEAPWPRPLVRFDVRIPAVRPISTLSSH
jgi:hypothetical protein